MKREMKLQDLYRKKTFFFDSALFREGRIFSHISTFVEDKKNLPRKISRSLKDNHERYGHVALKFVRQLGIIQRK